jgi:hypothetical protein
MERGGGVKSGVDRLREKSGCHSAGVVAHSRGASGEVFWRQLLSGWCMRHVMNALRRILSSFTKTFIPPQGAVTKNYEKR